jgi:hypothetical protein
LIGMSAYGVLGRVFSAQCEQGIAVGFNKKKDAALWRGFSRGVGGVVCCDVLAGGAKFSPRGEKCEGRNGFLEVLLKCEFLVSSLPV